MKIITIKHSIWLNIIAIIVWSCSMNKNKVQQNIEVFVTTADQKFLFSKQNNLLTLLEQPFDSITLQIDTNNELQTIEGFGYCLTGASAQLLNSLNETAKSNLLHELFDLDSGNLKLSYIRVSIGSSDLDTAVFSYDDLPFGSTDLPLENFSLAKDKLNLIPILKEILSINPNLKIIGSPWSAPAWMKSNHKTSGGALLTKYYATYATYFVKYIQSMKAEGININAVTIQNEPEHPGNNPAMVMTWQEQSNFIENYLGPAFEQNKINTEIFIYDHNCDHPDYPINILNNIKANKYITGSAFHLYVGNESALTKVHNAHPNKKIFFTEQWTGSKSNFKEDFLWHLEHVIIGTLNNFSQTAIEWNLISNQNCSLHTPGGCNECMGALTIEDGRVQKRNVSYYLLNHISPFISYGSKRIQHQLTGTSASKTTDVSFLTCKNSNGKIVVVVLNKGNNKSIGINIQNSNWMLNLPAESAVTINL
ncbi:MAG: glucosylceramidase [Sediminibacterium sp.]|nr:glucosylceramidase [Sediminibacterium sp.]